MAKKNLNGKKAGGISSIAVIEDDADDFRDTDTSTATIEEITETPAPKREKKPKAEKPAAAPNIPATNGAAAANGAVSIADIRKAASFVTAIGGLDKALSLLQILKVAKEVQ